MKFFHGRHNQCLPEFFEIQADLRSLYANRRNLITIFAIALTTLLFTTMFTIVLSLNASYETYQFRQVGGYAHGTFKVTSRPAIAAKRDNMDEYDTIFVGFPIWWYVAPTIINTFLESYNLKGKTLYVKPFATSGGSGMGKTNEKLAPSCPGAKLLHGKVFNSYSSKADFSAWVETLSL